METSAPRWHQLTAADAVRELNSDLAQGLAADEASRRLEEHGPNEIAEAGQRHWPRILLAQVQSSLVVLLGAAAVISIFLGETTDAIAVVAIIVLNTALGFWQDFQAERALAELKKLSVPEVQVRRGGLLETAPATQLVTGDVVMLQTGYFVPADCRVLEQSELEVDESALTGESLAVTKLVDPLEDPELPVGDQRNMVFMGTTVVRGHGAALVTGTGMSTELGEIAASLQQVESTATPLQVKLGQLGRVLALVAVVVVALIFLGGLWSGQKPRLMLMTALSMAVAIVPEGLPAVATVTLALGARQMFQRKALIRQLPAVETLGSVSVICSDKTGTLTQNRMTVTQYAPAGRQHQVRERQAELNESPLAADELWLALGCCLCNDAELQPTESPELQPTESPELQPAESPELQPAESPERAAPPTAVGEPTEKAMVEFAARLGVRQPDWRARMPRIAEAPFSSERKRMTTLHQFDESGWPDTPGDEFLQARGDAVALCKGAVESVMDVSTSAWIDGAKRPLDDGAMQRIDDIRDEMASEGTRVLAVACRTAATDESGEEMERDFMLVGLVGLEDPPRPEAKLAVARCRDAGIRPIMITGDHPLTALSIADQIGVETNGKVITGRQLAKMSDAELSELVRETSVFARVAPSDKLNIVQALKGHDEVVAMTGDGVNDAPALKKANVGVAMGITGTDVSKQAANVVLLDDNFSTIVAAVEQGRTVYDNIRKFVRYTMSSNVGEVFVMMVGVMFGMPLPLLPLQVLWVNLVTDGLPGLALAFEPTETGAMKRPPLPLSEPIFNRRMQRDVVWIGVWISAVSLLVGSWMIGSWAPTTDELSAGDHGGAASAEVALWRTIIFTALTFTQMANAFTCRSELPLRTGVQSGNRYLLGAVASTFLLQLAVIYLPPLQRIFHTVALSPLQLLVCVAGALLVFAAIEVRKLWASA